MFYQLQILSKKGKLARVWLAAHHEKKLTKTHIMATNIPRVVEDIMKSFQSTGKQDEVRMSLRLLGFLLLGTVKIHYKQADFLLKDCNDALANIKLAFRPGAKQESNNVANPTSITLREQDEEMVDFNMDVDLPFESLQDIEIDVEVDEMMPIDSFQAPRTAITQADQEGLPQDMDELPDDIGYVGPEFGEADLGAEDPYPDLDGGDQLGEDAHYEEPPQDFSEISQPAPEVQDAISEAIQAAYEQQESATSSARTARAVPVREDKLRTLSTKLMKRNIEDYTPILNENRSLVPRTKRLKVHEDADAEDVTVSFAKPGITVIAGFDSAIAGLFSKMAAPAAPRRRHQSIGGFVPRDDEEGGPQEQYDVGDAYIPNFDDMGSPGGPRESFGGDQPRRDEEGAEEGFYEEYQHDFGDMGDDLPEEERRPQVPAPIAAHKSVTKRTLTMHKFLTKNFEQKEELKYFDLVKNKKRSTAAQMFFELLVLKTRDCVDVTQDSPYGDITVTKNPEHFDNLVTM